MKRKAAEVRCLEDYKATIFPSQHPYNSMEPLRQKLSRLNRKIIPYMTFPRVLIAIVLGTVLYNEFLCYWIATFWWSSLSASNSAENLRILFVADPQLVGFNDAALARPISRLDCDRYVAKTFSYALSHVQPDVIIHMGDLLDEGSTANDEEYESYVNRFNSVFQTHLDIPRVVIPGDNDVGGEGFDRKTPEKMERFNRYLRPGGQKGQTTSNSLVQMKFVDFLTLNLDDHDRTVDEQYLADLNKLKSAEGKPGKFNIILNHFEMIERTDVSGLVKKFDTNFIFTAHRHTAAIYSCLDCREPKQDTPGRWRRNWRGGKMEMKDSKVHTFDVNARVTLSEIAIPTCSYRMGVPQMGYGSAILNSNGELQFTVLWLPSRYFYLVVYVLVLVIVALMLVVKCLAVVLCQYRKFNYNQSTLPLYNK